MSHDTRLRPNRQWSIRQAQTRTSRARRCCSRAAARSNFTAASLAARAVAARAAAEPAVKNPSGSATCAKQQRRMDEVQAALHTPLEMSLLWRSYWVVMRYDWLSPLPVAQRAQPTTHSDECSRTTQCIAWQEAGPFVDDQAGHLQQATCGSQLLVCSRQLLPQGHDLGCSRENRRFLGRMEAHFRAAACVTASHTPCCSHKGKWLLAMTAAVGQQREYEMCVMM